MTLGTTTARKGLLEGIDEGALEKLGTADGCDEG